MSEEDAKTQWCPFAHVARVVNIAPGAYALDGTPSNRLATADERTRLTPGSNCIGSVCMAWRWAQDAFEEAYERWDDAHNIGGITDFGPEPSILQYGYCGLAGRP